MTRALAVLVLILAGLLSIRIADSAATSSKTNGLYTAKVGATCQIGEGGYAAVLMSDLDLARSMLKANDMAAFRKLIETERVFYTKAGVTVFVEDRYEGDGRRNVRVRPQGEIATAWMGAFYLECQPPAPKKGK